MNAYLPTDDTILVATLGVIATTVLGAFVLTRLPVDRLTRGLAWVLTGGAFVTVERLTATEPAGFRMVAIIAALLLGLKGVVSLEWQAAGRPRLTAVQWWAFALGWLGMRPSVFAEFPGPVRVRAGEFLRRGVFWLLTGAAFFVAADWILEQTSLSTEAARRILAGGLLLVGVSFVLHFGIVNVMAGVWRFFGAETAPLFRAPAYSQTLTEFWGRRWNLAFSEMTAVAVYRPLRGVIGARWANVAAFLFSGLLHELAISLPVRAGYGLPMLYFVLHAIAMQIEQVLEARGHSLAQRGVAGRFWTAAWVLLPFPLLFHPPFVAGVILPLVGG